MPILPLAAILGAVVCDPSHGHLRGDARLLQGQFDGICRLRQILPAPLPGT